MSLLLPEGWKVCQLSDAMAGTGQKPPWVIRDLLLADSATQVSAHPHSMKSLSWLAAALEAPAKHTVWGHFDAAKVGSTLFIETEDPHWVIEERIRCLAKGLGLARTDAVPGFHYIRTGPFDLVNLEDKLDEIFDYYRPDFTVLSTLQNLLNGRDWKQQNDMQDVNAAIVRLASRCCPMVVITHSPWDKRAKRAAGTITQAANFLTTMHFEKVIDPKTAGTYVRASVNSKIGAEETDFGLRLETEGEGKQREVRRIVYEKSGWPKGLAKSAVEAAIQRDPDAHPRSIAEQVGVSVRYVQEIMHEIRKK